MLYMHHFLQIFNEFFFNLRPNSVSTHTLIQTILGRKQILYILFSTLGKENRYVYDKDQHFSIFPCKRFKGP